LTPTGLLMEGHFTQNPAHPYCYSLSLVIPDQQVIEESEDYDNSSKQCDPFPAQTPVKINPADGESNERYYEQNFRGNEQNRLALWKRMRRF